MSVSIANKNILLLGLENCGGEYLIEQNKKILNKNINKEGYLYKLYSLFPLQFYYLIKIGFSTSRLYPKLLTLPKSIISNNVNDTINGEHDNNNLKSGVNTFINKHAKILTNIDGYILFYHANIPSSFYILSKLLRSLINFKKSDRFPLIICELSGFFKLKNEVITNDRSIDLKDSIKLSSRYCFDLKFLCFTNKSDDYVSNTIFMSPNLLTDIPFNSSFNLNDYSTECIKIKDKTEMLMDCIMQEIYSSESIKRIIRQRRRDERDKFRKVAHGNDDSEDLISNLFISKTLFLLILVVLISVLIFTLFSGKPNTSFKDYRENPISSLFKRDQGEKNKNNPFFSKTNGPLKRNFFLDWYCSNIASYKMNEELLSSESSIDFISKKLLRRPNLLNWIDSYCDKDLKI